MYIFEQKKIENKKKIFKKKMKRRYQDHFPIVGLDFAPEKEDDVDITGLRIYTRKIRTIYSG